MSMRYYSVNDCGLFIDEALMDEITLAYNNEKDSEFDADNVAEILDLARFGDVEGEFTPFDRTLDSIELDSERFYILSLERSKSLFSQAYSDIDEAEKELAAKIGKYVATDFDYKSRFGDIIG